MPPSLRQIGSEVIVKSGAVVRALNQKSKCVYLNSSISLN